jgi:hypothetical protein
MPRIFDNIDQSLLPALRETLALSDRADFCVGYLNLRGWRQIDELINRWSGGPGHCCRLLVGMQRLPQEELWEALNVLHAEQGIDNQTALGLKKRLAEEFRTQLTLGVPTDADESGLRRLASQIRAKKVVVKLFLRHPLHAKLYLLFRPDPISPKVGYLGSLAWRFSPESNEKRGEVSAADELQVLVATDILSEGQNLQDGAIVVNFDLPWAIIRLIQRAGRVDRIGQRAEEILCYTFLPADGIERIIRLRARVASD